MICPGIRLFLDVNQIRWVEVPTVILGQAEAGHILGVHHVVDLEGANQLGNFFNFFINIELMMIIHFF